MKKYIVVGDFIWTRSMRQTVETKIIEAESHWDALKEFNKQMDGSMERCNQGFRPEVKLVAEYDENTLWRGDIDKKAKEERELAELARLKAKYD